MIKFPGWRQQNNEGPPDLDEVMRDLSRKINAMFGTQMSDPKAGIEEMRDAGVGRIMIPAFFFAGPGGLDRMAALAEQIMPLAAE